jgi:hypothetical protein
VAWQELKGLSDDVIEAIREDGFLSFNLKPGPYFHDPMVFCVPVEGSGGTYDMSRSGIRMGVKDAEKREIEMFNLSRRSEG